MEPEGDAAFQTDCAERAGAFSQRERERSVRGVLFSHWLVEIMSIGAAQTAGPGSGTPMFMSLGTLCVRAKNQFLPRPTRLLASAK